MKQKSLVCALILKSLSGDLACAQAGEIERETWYELKERSGRIDHLYLYNCTVLQAVKLMEKHLGATVEIDRAAQKKLQKTRITMSFEPMSWRTALVSLALFNGAKIEQVGREKYVIHPSNYKMRGTIISE